MVQEFMILRCFSCTTFQVHQVKKSKKWACKVCGEKQSVKKVYAQGSGQDCRRHVQKLNMKCGEAQMMKDFNSACDSDDNNDCCEFTENITNVISVGPITSGTTHEDVTRLTTGESKWTKFMDVTTSDYTGADVLDEFNVTTERDDFDKASSRGKRKLAYQRGTANPHHQPKRLKSNAKENYQGFNTLDAGNTIGRVRNFFQSSLDPNLQLGTSSHTSNLHGAASEEEGIGTQLCCSGIAPCANLVQLTPQNSQNKCNLYFAKATRDPSAVKKDSTVVSEHVQTQSSVASASRWAKFMSNSSPDTDLTSDIQSSALSTGYLDTTTVCSKKHIGVNENHCNWPNSAKLFDHASGKSQVKSLVVADLFQVDDSLEGEWWNQ